MSEPDIPPLLETAPAPEATRTQPKWRWAVSLILLAGYVLGIGLIGATMRDATVGGAALPGNVRGLLLLCAQEVIFFGVVFAVAWWFSRASVEQLYLKWRGGIKPILWGALHSVLLRLAIAVLLFIVVAPLAAIRGEKGVEEDLKGLRPKVEAVVEPSALQNPAYLLLTLTVISFVVAGLREELWRAGMLAGLAGLAPSLFGSRKGQYAAVFVAAVVFGLGHAPQGWGGVVMTGILGIGLGVIMVAHRSIWEAVMAHGFFNASTFALLYVIMKVAPDLMKSFGIS